MCQPAHRPLSMAQIRVCCGFQPCGIYIMQSYEGGGFFFISSPRCYTLHKTQVVLAAWCGMGYSGLCELCGQVHFDDKLGIVHFQGSTVGQCNQLRQRDRRHENMAGIELGSDETDSCRRGLDEGPNTPNPAFKSALALWLSLSLLYIGYQILYLFLVILTVHLTLLVSSPSAFLRRKH